MATRAVADPEIPLVQFDPASCRRQINEKVPPKWLEMPSSSRFGPLDSAVRPAVGDLGQRGCALRPRMGAKRPSEGDNELACRCTRRRDEVADSSVKTCKTEAAQAAHRVRMNPAMFQAMSLALYKLSVRELQTCSPRRLLTHVLTESQGSIFRINIRELDAICNLDHLAGTVRVNIRLDSSVNAQLREFRENAEQQLGRAVSVLEAINACIYVVTHD